MDDREQRSDLALLGLLGVCDRNGSLGEKDEEEEEEADKEHFTETSKTEISAIMRNVVEGNSLGLLFGTHTSGRPGRSR